MTEPEEWMMPEYDKPIIIEEVLMGDCMSYGIGFGPNAAEMKIRLEDGRNFYIGLSEYVTSVTYTISPRSQMVLLCGALDTEDPIGDLKKDGWYIPIRKYKDYYNCSAYSFFPAFAALRYTLDHYKDFDFTDAYMDSLKGRDIQQLDVPDMKDNDWEIR